MSAQPRRAVYLLIGVTAALLFAAGAEARLPTGCSDANPCGTRLLATDHIKRWRSPQAAPTNAVVRVTVSVKGHLLTSSLEGLDAYYTGRGVAVHVRAERRTAPIRVSYVSFAGRRAVRVVYWFD